MIRALNCEPEEFLKQTEGKRIFCFGSGKYFREFIGHHPRLSVCGAIDNYRQEAAVSVENNDYQIYSIQDFSRIYNDDCVLVITVRAFEEVVDQLDAVKELNGIPCYFPFVAEDYFNVSDDLRQLMKSQVKKLSERTSVGGQETDEKRSGEGRYLIWEYIERLNIGGSKARTDICDILTRHGYQVTKIHCSGRESGNLATQQMWEEWKDFYEGIEENAVVCMQHPIPAKVDAPGHIWRRMKAEKHTRFIVIIHEVEGLRKTYFEPYREKEFQDVLAIGDVFIVHNEVMRQHFLDLGIEEERIISLTIFDYLDSQSNVKKEFERSVTIAANLDLIKSPYLLRLKELKSPQIHLYGPHYTEEIINGSRNIIYHGSFPTEVVPQKLDRGFGLIWDGDSVETCSGGTGEYLKYNNPHKLSLYLSSGLPVIIWSQAAEAQFVLEHGVGICVDSLHEVADRLEQMSEEQYMTYVQKTELISQKLKDGYYFKRALKRAEEVLCRL